MKTPKPQPFLSLVDATFRLGDRLVFENTSWTLHRNEQWAIVGPNGSGKSLLADALRARLPIVRGELYYGFRPLRGLSPEESISHVSFDDRKLEIHNTVAQSRWNSIEESGALLVRDFLSYERVMDVNPFEVTERHEQARPSFQRRRARAISLLRIRPFLERTLLSLSNGETQRVQLARALCHPLRLLILDEPFLGLDASTREQFREALDRLMQSSVRVLLITNRPEDLPTHVTHLLRVERCRVVEAGPRLPSDGSHKSGERGKTSAARRRSFGSATAGPTTPTMRRRIPGRPITQEPPAESSSNGPGPAGRELVRLKNITVRYGKAIILRDLNWRIEEGESWALVGPNGSGKSTLLSLIAGDHPQAYRNRIEVFGQRRGTGESIWELKKDIGWLSPELQVHFDDSISCFEVVASGFQDTVGVFEAPTTRQLAMARRSLARFDLLESAHTPLFALSTGLQRMVLLARALVKNPRLLILDEPCLGLDPAHRELLVSTVDSLLRAGSVTSIYVTHRADEIPPSITRTFRLPEGIAVRRDHSPG